MKKIILHSNSLVTCLALLLTLTFASCSKKDPAPETDNKGNNAGSFSIFNTWKCAQEDLPTESLKKMYKGLELIVNESDMSYVWKWNKYDGTTITFTGYIAHHMSTYKHSNNEPIWIIQINVSEINGQPAPGGWVGIYTSTGPGSMLLNVEPNISGITPPEAKNGIGSGKSGADAVFAFKK